MTREEYERRQIAKARDQGMSEAHWREVFRVYPCWCGHERCPGWRDWTDREIQVALATDGHFRGLEPLLLGDTEETR